jgi:hypothetical protein
VKGYRVSSAIDREAAIRARLQEHWEASERGDIDGVPTYSLSVMQITDGLVTHETQYFADPFPAPPGRAALAEPIPARE